MIETQVLMTVVDFSNGFSKKMKEGEGTPLMPPLWETLSRKLS